MALALRHVVHALGFRSMSAVCYRLHVCLDSARSAVHRRSPCSAQTAWPCCLSWAVKLMLPAVPGSQLLSSTAGGRDRPIEVTLQRAWHALSWAQRLDLAWSLVTSRPQASHLKLLKESASEEAMADVLQSLSTQYPQVSFAALPLQNWFAGPD